MKSYTACKHLFLAAALACLALSCAAVAQRGDSDGDDRGHDREHHLKIKSFSVSTDITLTYPSNLTNLPDEHTTFILLSDRDDFRWGHDRDTYLVFASSGLTGGNGGAVVLETTDLVNFTFATDRGYAEQVMHPAIQFLSCDPAFDMEFDENYSAPGSVVQDPTRPPGNFMMFYEAENHCPGGNHQQPFYATVGFARSSDFGRTWPQPVDAEFGGPERHPVLKGPIPEPTTNSNGAMGDAIPSAFVDRGYVYVAYSYHDLGLGAPQQIRVARARLGDDHGDFDRDHHDHDGDDQLHFLKWNNGSFSEPGIGGVDSPVLSAGGCDGRQGSPEISFNDDLGLYMMVLTCNTDPLDGHVAWFYSTATSLELQDWTPPQMIQGSRLPVVSPCNIKEGTGTLFDGWYPSFMTPGSPAGHTRLTGRAFFLKGCDTGQPREFLSRTFTIVTEPDHEFNAATDF